MKMTAMTVPIMEPSTVRRAATKVQRAIGKLHHLENIASGVANMEIVFIQMPVRKPPNIIWLAILISSKIVLTSEGSAIVAPARSSLSRISTGLNQYKAFGFEQCVIPSSL